MNRNLRSLALALVAWLLVIPAVSAEGDQSRHNGR